MGKKSEIADSRVKITYWPILNVTTVLGLLLNAHPSRNSTEARLTSPPHVVSLECPKKRPTPASGTPKMFLCDHPLSITWKSYKLKP
jgi:hypothetical protein